MKALALCVIYIGIDGALSGEKTLVAILSMVIGTVIGQILSLEESLRDWASLLNKNLRIKRSSSISQGFITATLLLRGFHGDKRLISKRI